MEQEHEGLLANLQGGVPHSSGDQRDLPQRLAGLAEDKRDILAGQGPSAAELDAAQLLEDWREVPEVHVALEGRVRNHTDLGDRRIRTFALYHIDEKRGYRVFCRSWRPPGTEPGWFEGACTLGWEILIVCFPEIATRWRRRFLDLLDDEEA